MKVQRGYGFHSLTGALRRQGIACRVREFPERPNYGVDRIPFWGFRLVLEDRDRSARPV